MAGYEVTRFICEVDEEFICSICAMVLKDAVQTQCDHLFCSDCIKDWLQIQRNCPLDKNLLEFDDLKPAARFFRNLLGKLQIKCDFESKGCESIVKLEHLQNHTDICVYNPNSEIICDKGCNLRMRRCDYAANNCFTHFADRVNSQNEQITELKGKLSDQLEENAKLIDEVTKQKVQITDLEVCVTNLRKQFMPKPLEMCGSRFYRNPHQPDPTLINFLITRPNP